MLLTIYLGVFQKTLQLNSLSHDVTSGSDITPCYKIEWFVRLVIVVFPDHTNYVLVTLRNDVHSKVAQKWQNLAFSLQKCDLM